MINNWEESQAEDKITKKPKGIRWEDFKPAWDKAKFAADMRRAGLTSHGAVIANQRQVLAIVREAWTLAVADINEFSRKEEGGNE